MTASEGQATAASSPLRSSPVAWGKAVLCDLDSELGRTANGMRAAAVLGLAILLLCLSAQRADAARLAFSGQHYRCCWRVT